MSSPSVSTSPASPASPAPPPPASSLGSILTRAVTPSSDWEEKEQLLDVIYWARQILGIIIGIVWGFLGVTGAKGLVGFAGLNSALILVYLSAFQKVDEEEFGGKWELTKEGFMTSSAGFVVTWVIIYTGMHFGEELM